RIEPASGREPPQILGDAMDGTIIQIAQPHASAGIRSVDAGIILLQEAGDAHPVLAQPADHRRQQRIDRRAALESDFGDGGGYLGHGVFESRPNRFVSKKARRWRCALPAPSRKCSLIWVNVSSRESFI